MINLDFPKTVVFIPLIYHSGFQTLFNRGDLDRPISQCCSTHVTDFEDFGSGELRPKPSPSDLKNTLFFRVPIF